MMKKRGRLGAFLGGGGQGRARRMGTQTTPLFPLFKENYNYQSTEHN